MRILFILLLVPFLSNGQEMWFETQFESLGEDSYVTWADGWTDQLYTVPPGPFAWGESEVGLTSQLILVDNAKEGDSALAISILPGNARNEIGVRADTDAPDPANLDYGVGFGAEYWLGYSFKIVDLADEGSWNIMAQMRGYANGFDDGVGKSNFYTVQANSTTLIFGFSTDPNEALSQAIGERSCAVCEQVFYSTYLDNAPITYNLNEWIDVVMHFVLDWDSDGLLEMWVNGKKVVDIPSGPTVYRYDAAGLEVEPFMTRTLGIYTGGGATGEVHYDAYRLWKGAGNYDLVAPNPIIPPIAVFDTLEKKKSIPVN